MRKMMIGLLILCMVMTAVPVSAEEYPGVGWDVSGQIDKAHFVYLLQSLWLNTGEAGSDEMLDVAEVLLGFVNGISFRGEAGKQAVKTQLYIQEQPIVTAGLGQAADGSVLFESSLLPGCVLTVPAEKLQQMEAQLAGMMNKKTPEEIAAATERCRQGMEALLQEISADFESKAVSVSEEMITKEVQGVPYTFGHAVEYHLTGVDLFQGMKKLMNGVLSLFAEYMIAIGVPEEEISIQLSDDELAENDGFARTMYTLICYTEAAADGMNPAKLWTAEMVDGAETMYAEVFQDHGTTGCAPLFLRIYRKMEEEEVTLLTLKAEMGETEEETYAVIVLDVTGTVFVLDVRQYPRMDGGQDIEVRVYLNNPDAPLGQLVVSWWPLAQAPEAPATEDKQVMDVLEPMDDTMRNQLQTALQSGAGSALLQVITAAPEETETLMNLLVQPQM